jgi:hypothetical protein
VKPSNLVGKEGRGERRRKEGKGVRRGMVSVVEHRC